MSRPLKIPVSVLVVIHDGAGRVLLLERADHPGFWQSVTGSLDAPDEDLLLAAQRELAEETGLRLPPEAWENWRESAQYEIYPHWRHRYPPGVTQNTEHVFSVCVPADAEVTLSPREHLRHAWLSWPEAAERCFSQTNVAAIRRLAGRLGWPDPRAQTWSDWLDQAVLYGVDFSSAPTARKPITVARARLLDQGADAHGLGCLAVEEVLELQSLSAFEDFLQTTGPWLGGFDLPFGQPRSLIEHYGWPSTWPELVEDFCARPREDLRLAFKAWCDARPVGDKFAWRQADKPAGSSPAMRWTNPPVAWMMQAGIGRMLKAGLIFPAHHHPAQPDWHGGRVALEAYPAYTARQVTRASYKSDTPAKQTADRKAARAEILTALCAGLPGLPRLSLSPDWAGRLVQEPAGDLLDAVICALQAAAAAQQPRFGLPLSLDPLEGWIATVLPMTSEPPQP